MSYLMRAIYWLYLVSKVYYMERSPRRSSLGIKEENEDEDEGMDSTVTELFDEEEELMHIHPEERIYKEILIEAKNY